MSDNRCIWFYELEERCVHVKQKSEKMTCPCAYCETIKSKNKDEARLLSTTYLRGVVAGYAECKKDNAISLKQAQDELQKAEKAVKHSTEMFKSFHNDIVKVLGIDKDLADQDPQYIYEAINALKQSKV